MDDKTCEESSPSKTVENEAQEKEKEQELVKILKNEF
jgi:hypothetical protein